MSHIFFEVMDAVGALFFFTFTGMALQAEELPAAATLAFVGALFLLALALVA